MRKIVIDSADWTVPALAQRLELHPRSIYAHIANGNLKASDLHGRFWLISHQDAEAFIADYKAGRFPVGRHSKTTN